MEIPTFSSFYNDTNHLLYIDLKKRDVEHMTEALRALTGDDSVNLKITSDTKTGQKNYSKVVRCQVTSDTPLNEDALAKIGRLERLLMEESQKPKKGFDLGTIDATKRSKTKPPQEEHIQQE